MWLDQNDKMKNSRFYDQRIIAYKNYGVKNLLSALKFYKMTFLIQFWGIKEYETKIYDIKILFGLLKF